MRFLVLALLAACHPPGYDKHDDVDAAISIDGTVGPAADGTVTAADLHPRVPARRSWQRRERVAVG